MWFRNLLIYRLTDPGFSLPDPVLPENALADTASDALQNRLEDQPFRPCGSQDTLSLGWVAPLPAGELLYHRAGDCTLFCQRRQQKVLPAAAVNEQLDEKIAEIEHAEARKVYRRERQQLKEDLTQTLLPRALTRSARGHVYFDARRRLLLVDGSNRNRAEELLNSLRECLGSLPAVPMDTRHSPESAMTVWLHEQQPPANFTLGRQCELRDPLTQTNVIRARDQDLDAEELRRHLDAGKQVTRLGLTWNDAVDFVLCEDGTLRGLKFADRLREQAEDAEDARARFDQSFAVMTLELGQLLDDLVAGLEGWAEAG